MKKAMLMILMMLAYSCYAESKFAKIFSVLKSEKYYFDMHGNACAGLQVLMNERFAATEEICKEIEKSEEGQKNEYIEALMSVLGFVKDLRSIPWLNEKWKSPEMKSFIVRSWFPRWYLASYAREANLMWIQGINRWSSFMIDKAIEEKDPATRLLLLRTLGTWFYDKDTASFMASIERDPKTVDKELIIAQMYLFTHFLPIDSEKLKGAIDRLKVKENQFLIEASVELRHEAFVKFLVGISDTKPEPYRGYSDAQYALEQITFVLDAKNKRDWQKWLKEYGRMKRKDWMEMAYNSSQVGTNVGNTM
jgi:hypothetical protein